jgi:hypothetical protein
LHSNIKQAVGSDYEKGPIEVGFPEGYKGPFNYECFRDGAEAYYQRCVGSSATGIRIGAGAHHIRMRNNTFTQRMTITCEVKEDSGVW